MLRLFMELLHQVAGPDNTFIWYLNLQTETFRWRLHHPTPGSGQATGGKATLQDLLASIAEADRPRYLHMLELAKASGRLQGSFLLWSPTQGQFVSVRVEGVVRYSRAGKPVAVLAVLQNLTAADKAAAEQRSQQAQIELLLDDPSLTIWLQDEDLRYIWIKNGQTSEAHLALLGKTDQELGLDWRFAQIIEAKQRALATGQDQRWEGWIDSYVTQRQTYMRVLLKPTVLPNGRLGLLGRAVDVSDTVRADQDIMVERSMFQLSMRLGGIASFVQGADKRYRWVYDPIMGFAGPEIIGKTDAELGLNNPNLEALYRWKDDVFLHQRASSSGFWVERGGERRYVNHQAEPFALPDGSPGLIGVAIDMTASKQQEEKLAEQTRLLQERTRQLEQQLDAKRKELEQARHLQLNMLPKRSLVATHAELAYDMTTAEEVGGDYLDYLQPAPNAFTLALGDATGHGMRAGIMVATVKSLFQCLGNSLPPAELLAQMGAQITGMELQQMFMGLLVLHFQDDHVLFSNAGMPPVLVYRAASRLVERHQAPALFLGTPLQESFATTRISLAPGDVVLAMSDGLMESFSATGVMLGVQAIAQCLQDAGHLSPGQILQALHKLRLQHAGTRPLADDVTVAVVKLKER